MSPVVASDVSPQSASRGGGAKKLAILVAKLSVTGACFWYLSRQIDLTQVLSAIPLLDFRWATFGTLVVVPAAPAFGPALVHDRRCAFKAHRAPDADRYDRRGRHWRVLRSGVAERGG